MASPQHSTFKPCIGHLTVTVDIVCWFRSVPLFFFFLFLCFTHFFADVHLQLGCAWCYFLRPTKTWEMQPRSLAALPSLHSALTWNSFSQTNEAQYLLGKDISKNQNASTKGPLQSVPWLQYVWVKKNFCLIVMIAIKYSEFEFEFCVLCLPETMKFSTANLQWLISGRFELHLVPLSPLC